MLERRYYIAVSHIYNDSKFKEQLTEKEKLSNAFFDIENKASSLISALQRAKLSGKLLTGEEIAELLYISYNKADSEHYKFENALKSKFSHLYTTAEPVERKAMKRRLKDLEKEEEKITKEIDELEEKVGA
jgi:predicted RNase H-like nuclease (RuvC/YqgF family)